jgi:general stress protein 26
MALAKRTGPDFLFLSNNHSQKFKDIEANPEVNVSFQDTKTQDWISVSGTATTSNSDPRIKEIWSRGAAAWFGDLGDGVHDGSATDPRMSLIEVKSKCMCFPSLLLLLGDKNSNVA